jgi:hypothetical protein
MPGYHDKYFDGQVTLKSNVTDIDIVMNADKLKALTLNLGTKVMDHLHEFEFTCNDFHHPFM